MNHYQVRFKAKNGNSKWKFKNTDSDENNVNISGLIANTKYTFQVRGIFGDEEGPYGPANEDIETKKSSATALLKSAVLQSNTKCPPIYFLPVKENKNARNTSARTKQVTLGRYIILLITFCPMFHETFSVITRKKIVNTAYAFNRDTYDRLLW